MAKLIEKLIETKNARELAFLEVNKTFVSYRFVGDDETKTDFITDWINNL